MTTLIGTNPDQVPVNSMLGGMAYQDPDSINVKDFNSSGTANIASLVSPAASITNLSYTGTLTGGTGVVNIGSSQIYKDASGNVGLGAAPISNGKTLTLVNTTTNPSSFYLQNSTTGFTTTDGTMLQVAGSASYLWNFENSTLSLGTNNTEYVRLTSTGDLLNLGTGATKLQEGTTAQRPASPQEGMIRKNSTLGVIEGYSGGGYVSLEAGRLIKVTTNTTVGHSSITLDPKTNYAIVEMIGGGGAGGNIQTGPYTTNYVCISGSGTPGRGVRLLLQKQYLQSTLYYYVGAGGTAGGSSGSNGANGEDTTLSFEVTTGAMTNYYTAGGGQGGQGNNTSALPPVGHGVSSYPSVTRNGTATNWNELEWSAIRGDSRAVLTSAGTVIQSGQYLSGLVVSPMTCFNQYGAGGYGGLGGQAWAGYVQGSTAAQGMIRIYEYS